jgi:hypothetical protein
MDPVEERVIVTTLQMAELIKHAANAFLATKITFINMIADLSEAARGAHALVVLTEWAGAPGPWSGPSGRSDGGALPGGRAQHLWPGGGSGRRPRICGNGQAVTTPQWLQSPVRKGLLVMNDGSVLKWGSFRTNPFCVCEYSGAPPRGSI